MKYKTLFLTIPILILLGLLLVGNPWLVTPAQAGDADDLLVKSFGRGFGPDGSGTVQFDLSSTSVDSWAIQPDGKYVAIRTNQNDDFWVARFNADGSKDTSFNYTGEVTTDIGLGTADRARDVIVQPDGKIVVVGSSDFIDFAVARYNPDGSLDSSFNSVGRLTTDFDGGSDGAKAVALQPDGKIVVGGWGEDCGIVFCDDDFAIARYNSDGTLDNSFSGDGRHLAGFGNNEVIDKLVVQDDGKIVAFGYAYDYTDSDYDTAIARYNADGSLDTTLDNDGKLRSNAFGEFAPSDAVVQPDGKIIAISYRAGEIARFNVDGSLDTTFGTDGRFALATSAGPIFASRVLLQPDNTILVAGRDTYSSEDDSQLILASYMPGSAPDSAFGDGAGFVTLDYGDKNFVRDIALEPDGKILVFSTSDGVHRLTRLYPDGSLDDGGRVTTNVSPGEAEQLNDTAVTSDGRIVTVGYHYLLGTDRMTAVRYSADGSLDTSFNGTGIVSQSPGGGPAAQHTYGQAVALDADDNIVIAGRKVRITQSQGDIALWRYQPDGSTDFFTTLDLGGDETARAVAVQPDGKILVAGEAGIDLLGTLYFLARFNADGSLDDTFVGGGYTFSNFANQSDFNGVNDLTLQPDGKIVLAGWNNDAGNFNFGLARHLANGNPDLAFGDGVGSVVTDLGGIDEATAVTVLYNGDIVVTGHGGITNNEVMITLYKPDGVKYATYGASFGIPARAYDMTLAANGDIVIAGCTVGSDYRFALVRFNPLSRLFDTDFSGDGQAAFTLSNPYECATGIALDSTTGDLIAAGYIQGIDDPQAALVRVSSGDDPNHAPVTGKDVFYTLTNNDLMVSAPGILHNDYDNDEDSLTPVLIEPPANGTLTLNLDGSFTYSPDAGFTGTDSFAYYVHDGVFTSAHAETVTINVLAEGENVPPFALDDSYETDRNVPLTIPAPGVLVNDGDADGSGSPLTAQLVQQAVNGTVELDPEGAFTYAPDEGFVGSDRFTYRVSDGLDESEPTTVNITVKAGAAGANQVFLPLVVK
ncbi:MAG: tandem-95 repeat protein [Anaerolineaceae bacterium]|nr:tandem-95 repeat protein [Anaerolineaceae bacterium]